jgi:hypothetical protein
MKKVKVDAENENILVIPQSSAPATKSNILVIPQSSAPATKSKAESILVIPQSSAPATKSKAAKSAPLTVETSSENGSKDSNSLPSKKDGPDSLTVKLKKMKSPRPLEIDTASTGSGNTSDRSDISELGSNKKPKIKADPKPHCVLCHIDFSTKNKVCIIQHELYEDKDIPHVIRKAEDKPSCHMVFCSFCKYKGCSSNCKEFLNQPHACYIGEHMTSKKEAKEELLDFNQDCSICYPDSMDVLDFVMGRVVFEDRVIPL